MVPVTLRRIGSWTWGNLPFMGSEGQSGGLVTLAIATSHLRVNGETLGLVTLRKYHLANCFLEPRADA